MQIAYVSSRELASGPPPPQRSPGALPGIPWDCRPAVAATHSHAGALSGVRLVCLWSEVAPVVRAQRSLELLGPQAPTGNPRSSPRIPLRDSRAYSEWRARPGKGIVKGDPSTLEQRLSSTAVEALWPVQKHNFVGSERTHTTTITHTQPMSLQRAFANGASPLGSHPGAMGLSSLWVWEASGRRIFDNLSLECQAHGCQFFDGHGGWMQVSGPEFIILILRHNFPTSQEAHVLRAGLEVFSIAPRKSERGAPKV